MSDLATAKPNVKIPGRAIRKWKRADIGRVLLAFAGVYLLYAFAHWHGGPWPQPASAWPWSMLGVNHFDGGFWKTVIYSAVVAAFWLPAYRRWTSAKVGHMAAFHRLRYISILLCQVGLFFLLPYFVLRHYDPVNWWRIYGIFMPFPLVWEVFFEAPWSWTIAAALFAFVVLPIVVRFTGNGFCSWVCGCGCLAETLGDRWRHLSPKGPKAVRAERWIWATTAASFLLAPIYIWYRAHSVGTVDSEVYAWLQSNTPPPPEALRGAAEGSRAWYTYFVDFWYAGVVGVATYFFFGSRIWCRFGCPLRKYIEILAGWYSKMKITAADRCIACGKCDEDCEMGIPVMEFALARKPLDNSNSSCIQCGVCISVCPTYDLGFGDRPDWEAKFASRGFEDKRNEKSVVNGARNAARIAEALADPAVGVHARWFKASHGNNPSPQ